MQEYQNTSQVQNLQQRKVRQAVSPEATSLPRGLTQHVLQLQRTVGNRKVGQFLQAKRLTPQGKNLGLQRKLTVGAANDQYEQEADRVARQVMNTSDAAVAQSLQRTMTPEEGEEQKIQTKPVADSITRFVQRQEQGKEKEESIQTKASESLSDSFEAGADVETQLNQSEGHGSSLPDSVRTYMEPRFGTDFSHVRAHTGSAAVQMNRDVGAQAFTHGADIYYGEGRNPTNLELTAHELTHVVQQTGNLQNKPVARRRLLVQRDTEDAPQLDAELQACLAAEPFDRMRAAELLNGFNREDIQARLQPLSAERIAEIHQGAVENPAVGPDSQVALLTQATPAEVTQGDTGAGGAGPVPPTADVGAGGAPGSGHDGTDGGPGVEVLPETDTDVLPTTDVGTGGAPGSGHDGTDGGPGVEVPEEIDDEKAVELVHDALDVAGLAPGPIGVVTDGLNACIYAEEGDWTNAGLSAASVVLSLGGGLVGVVLIEGVIKISKTAMAKRGVKAAKEWIADAFKAGRKIPEGVKDFATLMRLRNIIVGDLVKSLDEGHDILRRLTDGDASALERIGVNTPPKDFDPRINEWGLGELPDGQYVVIKGEDFAVDWESGPLKNVKPVAHTHTLTNERLLRGKAAQGATLDDLFGGGMDFETNLAKSFVVPSVSDFRVAVNKGLDKHVVHTPYVHLGGGKIGNPQPGIRGQGVDFEIIEPRITKTHSSGQPFYQAKLRALSEGECIWESEVTALYNPNVGDMVDKVK